MSSKETIAEAITWAKNRKKQGADLMERPSQTRWDIRRTLEHQFNLNVDEIATVNRAIR